MWDVKIPIKHRYSILNVRFYLNYVGCKDAIITIIGVPQRRFYLNYVGCKDDEQRIFVVLKASFI